MNINSFKCLHHSESNWYDIKSRITSNLKMIIIGLNHKLSVIIFANTIKHPIVDETGKIYKQWQHRKHHTTNKCKCNKTFTLKELSSD